MLRLYKGPGGNRNTVLPSGRTQHGAKEALFKFNEMTALTRSGEGDCTVPENTAKPEESGMNQALASLACLMDRPIRFFFSSTLRTTTCTTSPTERTSDGWRMKRSEISEICTRPS